MSDLDRAWIDLLLLSFLRPAKTKDAWQMAVADRAHATIVGRDRNAFSHLGNRYEQFSLRQFSPREN